MACHLCVTSLVLILQPPPAHRLMPLCINAVSCAVAHGASLLSCPQWSIYSTFRSSKDVSGDDVTCNRRCSLNTRLKHNPGKFRGHSAAPQDSVCVSAQDSHQQARECDRHAMNADAAWWPIYPLVIIPVKQRLANFYLVSSKSCLW